MRTGTRMSYLTEQTNIVINLARMIKKEYDSNTNGTRLSWRIAISMAYNISLKVEEKRIQGGL